MQTENLTFHCRELGIGIVPYSPLGRAFLSAGAKLIENLEDGDFRKVFLIYYSYFVHFSFMNSFSFLIDVCFHLHISFLCFYPFPCRTNRDIV